MKVAVSTRFKERRKGERRMTKQVNGDKWVIGIAIVVTIMGMMMTKVWTAQQELKLVKLERSIHANKD